MATISMRCGWIIVLDVAHIFMSKMFEKFQLAIGALR